MIPTSVVEMFENAQDFSKNNHLFCSNERCYDQCLRPVVLVRLRVAACIPATVTEAAAVAVAAKARIEILLLGVGVPEEIL